LIGIYIDEQGTNAVALEVNCETDFVAKNTIFRQLVSNVTRRIAEATPVHANASTATQALGRYTIGQEQLDAFQDEVGEAVVQLGEKIRLSRALIVRSQVDSGKAIRLVGYTHSAAGSNLIDQGVLLGRYGTIAAFEAQFTPEQYKTLLEQPAQLDEEGYEIEKPVSFEECTRNVCQHIIGMKPKSLGPQQPAEPPASTEVVQTNKDEEPETLLDQSFLLDDEKTVREYANFNQVQIVDFVRIECGDSSSE
jgi:elongation factor Ts